MTSTEYIKNKLSQILSQFPEISCKYEFDAFSASHLIELKPSEIYFSNHSFKEKEIELLSEFIELYPFENITFITDDDLYKIESPIFEKQSQVSFNNVSKVKEQNYWDQLINFDLENIYVKSIKLKVSDFIDYTILFNNLQDFSNSIPIRPLRPQEPSDIANDDHYHLAA